MRITVKSYLALLALTVTALLTGTAQAAGASDLVGLLTSQLGVTESQARGGSGAILGHAKQNMAPSDWGRVAEAVPGIGGLLSAAPAVGSASTSGGAMGGLMGQAGSMLGGSLGSLSALAPAFESLGLSPDMIGQFVPVILDYVSSTGGQEVMGMLKSALS
jgi:hypothetical protein